MFIDERLLDCVAYGTQGGPTWLTRRISLRSGKVRRNPLRSRPTYKFGVIYRNLDADNHADVLNAFNACMGGVHSFRLKDWSDFEVTNELLAVAGTGSAQSLQLTKTYRFGSQAVARPIRKPVAGTVTMTQNGGALSASVDYDTGVATFTAGSGNVLRWSGEFDVPVMFSDDELSFDFSDKNAGGGFFLTGDVMLEEDTDA